MVWTRRSGALSGSLTSVKVTVPGRVDQEPARADFGMVRASAPSSQSVESIMGGLPGDRPSMLNSREGHQPQVLGNGHALASRRLLAKDGLQTQGMRLGYA